MLHKFRTWQVSVVESAEELADKLNKERGSWVLCQAFAVEGSEEYVFLNDSTSEDSPVEFAVVRYTTPDEEFEFTWPFECIQLESITFGWSTKERSLDYINRAISGEWDKLVGQGQYVIDVQPSESHSCRLCQ